VFGALKGSLLYQASLAIAFNYRWNALLLEARARASTWWRSRYTPGRNVRWWDISLQAFNLKGVGPGLATAVTWSGVFAARRSARITTISL